MLFNSVSFLIFFPIVVLGYFIAPKKAKNLWLLIASYYFYMCWQPVYALLILFSTVSTYWCAILISNTQEKTKKTIYLSINIIINLLILFYFKYFNFAVSVVSTLFPSITISQNNNLLAVVGISFYTFQSLGYSIDVYREKVHTEKNFLTYALFVSFFPQLVAGPIERSSNLLPQFHTTHSFEYQRVVNGLKLMAWGFFKKLVIADGAAQIINGVYSQPDQFVGVQLAMATFLFAFQIYGDFSGYSDIAIGAANVLGFKLMRNFKHPYFSQNIREFWRRWHISLSTWFMDYVYIPLGGSRKGEARTYINLLITFMVSGLWHGAAITFVVWGLLNGVYNVVSRLLSKTIFKDKPESTGIIKIIKIISTFLLINFSWIFFRANNMQDAFYIIQNIFSDIANWFNPEYFTNAMTGISFYNSNGIAIVVCIVIMLIVEAWEGKGDLIEKVSSLHWCLRWAAYYAIILLILFFGWFGTSQFIYFQF